MEHFPGVIAQPKIPKSTMVNTSPTRLAAGFGWGIVATIVMSRLH